MKKLICVLMVLVAIFALAACGNEPYRATIKVYNAADYLDDDLRKEFEKEYNIKVIYDTFDSNENMYSKVTGTADSYDIIIPSDYMVSRMIQEDLLLPLDFSKIPNAADIESQYKGMSYDPEDKYSVPYMTGTLGILYNTRLVNEPVESWDILWDSKYANQILMLDSERDALAVGLASLGFSINTSDPVELEMAVNKLIEQKERKLLNAYLTDEIKDNMVGGNAALAVTYSGEAFYAASEDPKGELDYAVPNEGSCKFVDAMVILKSSQNAEAAMEFINFLTSKEISARNSEYLGYTSPVNGARALMSEEVANSHILYPEQSIIENCDFFEYNPATKAMYSDAWLKVKMKMN